MDCLEAQISFPGSESFQAEQTIYVGDWSTTQGDDVSANEAASAGDDASGESDTATETTNEVASTTTEVNDEALNQEE